MPPIQEAFCCPLRQSLGAMMRFTAAKLGAVHASAIVVVRGRREAGLEGCCLWLAPKPHTWENVDQIAARGAAGRR